MKAFILGMDINRATCDPELYPDDSYYTRSILQQLDETARQIADFDSEVRDHARFIWAMQQSETTPGKERDYTPQEMAFHRVTPYPMDDDFLPKTQMSPYPEHRDFFDNLREEGYEVGLVRGFHASKCIYWGLHNLMFEAKFKMIVVPELIGEGDGTHPLNAFDSDCMIRATYNGQLIFTSRQNALHFLQTPEDMRRLPYPTITGEDLNMMHYGMGS